MQTTQNLQLQKSQTSLSLQSTEASYSQDDKAAIAAQLASCLATQRTYGKQAADITAVAKIFLEDLKEFSGYNVAQAIARWRKTSPEFPTPADIINLLNPKPQFDRAVYTALNKRRADLAPYSKELAYLEAYEKHILDKIQLTKKEESKPIIKARPANSDIPELTKQEVADLIAEFNQKVVNKPQQTIEEMEREFLASETELPQPQNNSQSAYKDFDIMQNDDILSKSTITQGGL